MRITVESPTSIGFLQEPQRTLSLSEFAPESYRNLYRNLHRKLCRNLYRDHESSEAAEVPSVLLLSSSLITEEPAERARELPRSLATVDGNVDGSDPVPGTAWGSDPVTRPGRTKTLHSLLSTLIKNLHSDFSLTFRINRGGS